MTYIALSVGLVIGIWTGHYSTDPLQTSIGALIGVAIAASIKQLFRSSNADGKD